MNNIPMLLSLISEAKKLEKLDFENCFDDDKALLNVWMNRVLLFAKNHLSENEFKKEIINTHFHANVRGAKRTFDILVAYLRALSQYTPAYEVPIEGDKILPVSNRTQTTAESKYDVFISHANKDKIEYVDSLRTEINKLGINVFYDTDVLSWGDNWKKKILDGTAKSEFAIIIISKNFFGREWTERELKEFLERQNNSGQKIILPLLHDITFDELAEQYPSLSEIQCIKTCDYSKEQICILFAKELIKRLKGN